MTDQEDLISIFNDLLYKPLGLTLGAYINEKESRAYGACRFELNDLRVVSRNAKITPTKVGQFVTIWKRGLAGSTVPFDQTDTVDVVVINVKKDGEIGQFVFPRSILCQKGVFSTDSKPGKRGIRVYPAWDKPKSKQALRTQEWQLQYFLDIPSDRINWSRVKELYLLT